MENRSTLIADLQLSEATGYAARELALTLLRRQPKRTRRRTVAADKLRHPEGRRGLPGDRGDPHVAQNTSHRRSAIDGRDHPTCRPLHQPAHPQAGRVALRLHEDRGRRSESYGTSLCSATGRGS
jgi:hypothetical protein